VQYATMLSQPHYTFPSITEINLHPLPSALYYTSTFIHLHTTMTAVAGPSTASYLGRAADYVRPDFHQVNLDIEGYLKTERNLKLDEGESSF
jgi:hypothetical protein